MSKIEYTVGQTLYAKYSGFGSTEKPLELVVVKVRKNGWADCTSVPGGHGYTFTATGGMVGTKGDRFNSGMLIDKPQFEKLLAAQDLRVRIETAKRMASDLTKWDGRDKVGYLARIDKFRAFVEGC